MRTASGEGEQLVARRWLACWHERGVHMIEQTPTVIKEFDYDEEFKHLGYSASLIGRPAKSEAELLAIARRVTSVFRRKPSLAQCGASIVTSALRPKLVYVLAFAKVTPTAVEAIESTFGGMLRNVATSGRFNGTSCSVHWRRSARCADAGALPSSEPSRRPRLM